MKKLSYLLFLLIGAFYLSTGIFANETLDSWQGNWNSMSLYLNDKEVEGAFKAKAYAEIKNPLKAKEIVPRIKKELEERRKSDIVSMVIKGDTIEFFNNKLTKENILTEKSSGKGTYKFVGTAKDNNGREFKKFEAVNNNAPYKYFIIMPINKEEALKHFHFRYGNESFEALLKQNHFPTMIAFDSTYEVLRDEIYPAKLEDWNGIWNSFYAFLDDKTVQKAFEERAKTINERNPKKKTTKEEQKAADKKTFMSPYASIVIDGDTIAFYDKMQNSKDKREGKLIYKGKYEYKGNMVTTYSPVYKFETKDEKAPYKRVVFTYVHGGTGDGTIHFHLWVGNDSFENLYKPSEDGVWPSVTPYTTTAEDMYKDLRGASE